MTIVLPRDQDMEESTIGLDDSTKAIKKKSAYQLHTLVRKFQKSRSVTKMLFCMLLLVQLGLIYIWHHQDKLLASSRRVMKISEDQDQLAADNQESEKTSYIHLIDLFDAKDFAAESMDYKCSTYFDELYGYDPDWQIGDLDDMEYKIPLAKDRAAYEKQLYLMRRKTLRGLTKDQRWALKAEIASEVDGLVLNNFLIEDAIFNSVGHLKIFGKCFLEHSTSMNKYTNLEAKLFPWMTRELPEYKRWDGSEYKEGLIPRIGADGVVTTAQYDPTKEMFVSFMHKNMVGSGVVLSVSDAQLNNTERLIHALRYLDNEIPIQLVHRGDLSLQSQNKLITAARNDLMVFEAMDLPQARPIDLWFIDASKCISAQYVEAKKFEVYANKWIAMLFNTFDDVVFLDDDAIPFVKPSTFFSFKKYAKTGTVFYKDRFLEHVMQKGFHNLYLSLLPSENDEKFFEIPQMSDSIKNERFFTKRAQHMMEAGLVVMKRSTHFTGLLVSTHLQIWTPTATPVHGDKELFWLGQVISGGSIAFNEMAAGAGGWLDSYEAKNNICNIQPTHIHDEDGRSLLWVNSGLRFCKYDTWEHDFTASGFYQAGHANGMNFTSAEELRELYESPLTINTVIIPPDNLVSGNRGWKKRNNMGCEGYFFCAFDTVAGSYLGTKDLLGKLIRYRDAEVETHSQVAKIWASNWHKSMD